MEIKGYFDEGKPMINIYMEGSEVPIDVLVDTGFIGDDEYMTASGDIIPTTVYMGFIKWFGRTRRIAVLATCGKSNLIGMELLHFYKLTVTLSENRLLISES
jgi:predicted aspartyl protease